jgi:hypothetical protein
VTEKPVITRNEYGEITEIEHRGVLISTTPGTYGQVDVRIENVVIHIIADAVEIDGMVLDIVEEP